MALNIQKRRFPTRAGVGETYAADCTGRRRWFTGQREQPGTSGGRTLPGPLCGPSRFSRFQPPSNRLPSSPASPSSPEQMNAIFTSSTGVCPHASTRGDRCVWSSRPPCGIAGLVTHATMHTRNYMHNIAQHIHIAIYITMSMHVSRERVRVHARPGAQSSVSRSRTRRQSLARCAAGRARGGSRRTCRGTPTGRGS